MTNQPVPCLTTLHPSSTPPGVVVFGKTLDATRHVHAQFRRRTVDKRYLALIAGVPETADFVVEAPIDRHPVDK
jgi:23S rRNA pseudouridine1911/1915/1917 synthase